MFRTVAVSALATLCACSIVPGTVEAETLPVKVQVYCENDANPCGYNSLAEIKRDLLNEFATVNLIWRPTGIAFQLEEFELVVDSKYQNITNSKSEGGVGGQTNADLVLELRESADEDNSDRITMFAIPGLEYCWSAIPPSDEDVNHRGFFCGPGAGGDLLAHELGHHFCLAHTFRRQDPATHEDPFYDGDGIDDTAPDPGEIERPRDLKDAGPGHDVDSSNATKDDHIWCEASEETDVDPGSPRDSYCTSTCPVQLAGMLVESGESPDTENVMNYYGSEGCRGPFLRAGRRFEAFTRQQIEAVQSCRTDIDERSSVPDVCAGRGGDTDSDGLCDADDLCPSAISNWGDDTDGDGEPEQLDTDGDGTPDVCDNCTMTANADQSDIDADGRGDACDDDDDNDGCSDIVDANPQAAQVPVGRWLNGACDPPSGDMLGFEGDDTDGDGLANCVDSDDDDDGLADTDDPCPTTPDPGDASDHSFDCHFVRSCEWLEWTRLFDRDILRDRFDLRVRDLEFPTLPPELVWEVAGIRPINLADVALRREVYVRPHADHSAWQSLRRFAEGPASSRRAVGTWRIELFANGKFVTALRDVQAAEILAHTPVEGSLLVLDLGESDTSPVSIGATYAVAASSTAPLGGDDDTDGVPTLADNCPDQANRQQHDRDKDGVGDVCDADLDGDGSVTSVDYKLARKCRRYGTTKFVSATSEEDHDAEIAPSGAPYSPKSAKLERKERKKRLKIEKRVLSRRGCERADLDRNGVVDRLDAALVRALVAD